MPSRLRTFLLATAGALSLAACRIDTPTGHLHSDMSGTYAAAPAQAPVTVAQAYPAQAAYGSDIGSATSNGPMYDGYALAERAYAVDRSTYRRRPTYAFRYENSQPLVWRTADDYSIYAEPIDGGYRDYYYSPGADYPYFVRDAGYGYGYGPDGRLVALFDAAGALLPADRFGEVATVAADYYLRARGLRRYGGDEAYRIPVTDAYWAERESGYAGAQAPWIAAPERRPEWRAWRRTYPRDVAFYDEVAPRHDNGRHLGWYKHAGRGDESFAFAYAQPRGNWAYDAERGGGKHGDKGEGHGHGHEEGGGEHGGGHGEGHGHGKGHD